MPVLLGLVGNDALAITAALVGRFYAEGLVWALALPLPELIRWKRLVDPVRDAEPLLRVVPYRMK